MTGSPRIHLVGLGAVGAGYGARLLDAGFDVRVLVDDDRRDRYASVLTTVNGTGYTFPLVDPADATPADLVIVAVKSPALTGAIDLLRPRVGASTVVISLLNGIDSERLLAQALPQARVLLAVSVGIDAVRDGRDVRYTSLGRIVLGEPVNAEPYSEAVQQVTAVLARAGIAYVVPADMTRELWWKFLVNVGVNQVSAVLRAPYRVFQEAGSPAREAMLAAQREVIAVANAEGVELTEADLATWLDVLAGLGPDAYTSMAQDAIAGRPTEVDIFAGRVCELGEKHGVGTPVNRVLRQLLLAGETVNRG
jgi:2-dehydropantoate 2-reductase